MKDLSYEVGAGDTLEALLPETLEQAEGLASRVERAVRHHTAGSIRQLAVEVRGGEVRLRGHCSTYYSKQLAQHAAMEAPGARHVTNLIEVF